MAVQRLDNAPDKQALKAASGALVRAVGGVEAAEGYCRANFRRLSEYGRPDNDCFMPIDVVADLQTVAHGTPGFPQVTRFLARRDGYALVKLPEPGGVSTDNLVAALAQASREHSDIATGMLEALRDGEVTAEEAKRLHREALESAEAAMRLAALLSQRSGEP